MQRAWGGFVIAAAVSVVVGAACSGTEPTIGTPTPTAADTPPAATSAPPTTTGPTTTGPTTNPTTVSPNTGGTTVPAGTAAVEGPMPTSGAYTIDVGGTEREYLLHVPDDVSIGAALVLVLHGYTDTASNVAAYTGFDAVADAEGFVVAYPQGMVDDLGATFFDVGYAFHERRVDDVGFLRALAADLVDRLDLDPDSVFVTGMSNGGDMAYVLVCSDQSWVAAVAPVAGMMLESVAAACSPTSRTPVLEIHGTADEVTLWDGDPGNVGGWGAYLSQVAAMQFLAEEYGLEQTAEAPIPELSEAWDRPVVATRWSTAVDDTEVTLLRIEGGAHVWPGIEASVAVWDFFDSHRP